MRAYATLLALAVAGATLLTSTASAAPGVVQQQLHECVQSGYAP